MKELSLDELLATIESAGKEDEWHFHYLTPSCIFNKTKFNQVILEIRGETYFTNSVQKPIKYLERIENKFYGRD